MSLCSNCSFYFDKIPNKKQGREEEFIWLTVWKHSVPWQQEDVATPCILIGQEVERLNSNLQGSQLSSAAHILQWGLITERSPSSQNNTVCPREPNRDTIKSAQTIALSECLRTSVFETEWSQTLKLKQPSSVCVNEDYTHEGFVVWFFWASLTIVICYCCFTISRACRENPLNQWRWNGGEHQKTEHHK